jgi:transcriptional regulator with XRE-family HTH domain
MLIKPIARPHTEKGIFIRSRREALGMSLNVFARKMGPTLKWAQQLEVGRADSIRYSTLKPLAHALDLDISDLTRFVRSGRNETKSELGRLVRSRRKELGMSLEALGQKLHVSKQYVDYIETGQCPLSSGDEVIVRLASSLQLDASKLYAVRSQRKLMSPRRVRGLGGFLAARRVQLHLTQRELAKRACLNPSSICSIEVGIANPSLTTLYKLSTALGCKIPSVF